MLDLAIETSQAFNTQMPIPLKVGGKGQSGATGLYPHIPFCVFGGTREEGAPYAEYRQRTISDVLNSMALRRV